MTTTQQHTTTWEGQNVWGAGTRIPFDQINEPGCYVCEWSGHLMRVPPDGIQPGRSPLVNIVGRDLLYVTKISDNPFIPVTKARLFASNYDLAVNF